MKILAVYVETSDASTINLQHSLKVGVWGFKEESKPDNFERGLALGDMIVLGTAQTGRGPRVPFEEWRKYSLEKIWAGKVSHPPFKDHEPERPDEENLPFEKRYYWRVGFDHLILRRFTNIGLSDDKKYQQHCPKNFEVPAVRMEKAIY